MLNSAHNIISARLQMWGAFFSTGYDASPVGATDDEYGLDNLIDMARDTDSLALHRLADEMDHAGQEYIASMNQHIFDVLMQEYPPEPAVMPTVGYKAAVSMEELEAVLAG